MNWGPVWDRDFLPSRPFAGEAPATAANIPLLIGSTLSEFQLISPRLAGRQSWTDDQSMAFLRGMYGDRTDAIAAAFRRAYPGMKPYDWPTVDFAGRSGALSVADGAWAAGALNRARLRFQQRGTGHPVIRWRRGSRRLTDRISQAWIDFARTGNPSHRGLPNWPRFTAQNPATMIFQARSELKVGHDAELITQLTQGPAR